MTISHEPRPSPQRRKSARRDQFDQAFPQLDLDAQQRALAAAYALIFSGRADELTQLRHRVRDSL